MTIPKTEEARSPVKYSRMGPRLELIRTTDTRSNDDGKTMLCRSDNSCLSDSIFIINCPKLVPLKKQVNVGPLVDHWIHKTGSHNNITKLSCRKIDEFVATVVQQQLIA